MKTAKKMILGLITGLLFALLFIGLTILIADWGSKL